MRQLISGPQLLAFALLALPLWPARGYYPLAIGILALVLFALSLRAPRPPQGGTWTDWGMTLFLGANLGHWVLHSLANGTLYQNHQSHIYLLLGLSWFCLKPWFPQLFQWKVLGRTAFAGLILLSAFVCFHALGHTYAELTGLLNYRNGIGNISQIATLASFFLILILGLRPTQQIIPILALGLTLSLSLILHSKLLLLATGIGSLYLLLSSKTHSYQKGIALIVLLAGALIFTIFPPESLQGRHDVWTHSLRNLDSQVLLGWGPGNFKTFINQVYLSGSEINTVGEIHAYAFNDLLQISLELGLAGMISLGLLLTSLFQGKFPLLSLLLISSLWIMFPLQYAETGLPFILCLGLLSDDQKRVSLPRLPQLKPILASLLLVFSLYVMIIHHIWQQSDQNPSTALSDYQHLYPHLKNDEIFLRKYAHLLNSSGYDKDAEQKLQRGLRISQSYDLHLAIGDHYYHNQTWAKARLSYQRASRLRPQNLYPLYRQAYTYWQAGDTAQARKLCQQALNTFPTGGHPQIQAMIRDLRQLLQAT